MRDFTKLSPAIWLLGRFTKLPSDDARLLHFYYLTCPHQNSAGCYSLPDGYACVDLNWTVDKYTLTRQHLVDADMVRFDTETNEILVERWFRHNGPTSPSHLKGIERIIERVQSNQLREAAANALAASWRESQAKQEAKASGGGARAASIGHGLLNSPHLSRAR